MRRSSKMMSAIFSCRILSNHSYLCLICFSWKKWKNQKSHRCLHENFINVSNWAQVCNQKPILFGIENSNVSQQIHPNPDCSTSTIQSFYSSIHFMNFNNYTNFISVFYKQLQKKHKRLLKQNWELYQRATSELLILEVEWTKKF